MTDIDMLQGHAGMVLDQSARNLLFLSARTANKFTDEPVSDDTLKAIYDLVKWAPTSLNQQPLRAVMVRSQPARQRLVDCMYGANKEKTAKAPVAIIFAADIDFHEHLPRLYPVYPQAKDEMFADRKVRVESARLNAALEIAYFILGVRAAGLAAGPMTGFDVEKLQQVFFADGKYQALVVMNIGKPGAGAWFDRMPRLEYGDVFSVV